uniref:BPTI/Kunitz inhibitor domain-containing protein n=1 Tax=Sinocyclocheilus rhinocerous TaxID=307959 RepID=A0A673NPX8_9TELE
INNIYFLFFISLFLTARQVCTLPKKPGECFGHYLRYYYSPEHHTCKSFYWTGCVGNGNRFLTLNWCNATCYNAAGRYVANSDFTQRSICKRIILGVVFGLIGAVIFIVVIVFAVKNK